MRANFKMQRLFIDAPLAAGAAIEAGSDHFNYLINVLRMAEGDEVLVFKQFDSAEDMPCYTPHAAFAHPATPPGTPPRESIEIRCLLIFD